MKITADIELRSDGILMLCEHAGGDRMVSLRPDGSVRTFAYDPADVLAGVRLHEQPDAFALALKWLAGGPRP